MAGDLSINMAERVAEIKKVYVPSRLPAPKQPARHRSHPSRLQGQTCTSPKACRPGRKVMAQRKTGVHERELTPLLTLTEKFTWVRGEMTHCSPRIYACNATTTLRESGWTHRTPTSPLLVTGAPRPRQILVQDPIMGSRLACFPDRAGYPDRTAV